VCVWCVCVCVCVCDRPFLPFCVIIFDFFLDFKLYVFVRIAIVFIVYCLYSPFKKNRILESCISRDVEQLCPSDANEYVSPNAFFHLNTETESATENFVFGTLDVSMSPEKRVTLWATYLHQYSMELEWFHNLYPSPDKISMIKLTRTRWADMSYSLKAAKWFGRKAWMSET